MPGKPTLCPIVEIKIPQNPSYDGHIRRQTPEIGSRAQKGHLSNALRFSRQGARDSYRE
jgi:hypothetical protein